MMTNPNIGIIIYPGSNCDEDCIHTFHDFFNINLYKVWHTERSLPKLDALIIPGGFSFGDYLRAGKLASLSPVTPEIIKHSEQGRAILGICNGFQILTESKLLPGTLLHNNPYRFVCKNVELNTPQSNSFLTKFTKQQKLRLPVAHAQGRYFCKKETLKNLEDSGDIIFTYKNDKINGSTANIAGITSKNKRIWGMMPHPERACNRFLNTGTDGKAIISAFLASFM